MTGLLELVGVTQRFGGVVALSEIDLSVPEGSIFALIGPNGAGKTTVFNLVTGVYTPTEGEIRFAGTVISGRRPHLVTTSGVARTFQNIRLFDNMTALENVMVGADAQHKTSVFGAALGLPRHRREERQGRSRGHELLEFVGIPTVAEETAKNLSYGNQRRLEIARALMLDPKLLLLDEPAAGMNYGEAEGLKKQIRWLRERFGLSIVLVEHNMRVVMRACEHVHCVDHGETIAEGTPGEVREHPAVLAAYLGDDALTARTGAA